MTVEDDGGTLGAALSYAIPVVILYVIFFLTANRQLKKLSTSLTMATTASLTDEDRDEHSV